jgi:hypothetical protein
VRATTSAGLLALLAASACGTDTIDLLPTQLAGGTSGANAGSGGDAPGPASVAGSAGSSTTPTTGGYAGSTPVGEHGQGGENDGGDHGFGGFGQAGSGGSFGWPNCVPGTGFCERCSSKDECSSGWFCLQHPQLGGICVQPCGDDWCPPGDACDVQQQRCAHGCTSDQHCSDGRVCDSEQSLCVQCVENQDCAQGNEPEERVCANHRCVECTGDEQCDAPRPFCVSTRCSECKKDEDCGQNRFCAFARGRCE